MKTIQLSSGYQNVYKYERVFRGVFGIGILTAVITGIVASPMSIFSIVIAVYLVMTATLGTDPIYAAAHAIKK
jgi:hypothetical protein